MIIYFLRHASAGKAHANAKKDERRPLDQEGILQARYVGRMLASLDVQVEQIVSSPLTRALQTASLVANELAFEAEVQRDEALRPESEYAQFRAMTQRYRKVESIMVVGHNPSLTEFLAKSVGSPSGAAHIELKKGAVAKVDMNGRSGLLEWLIPARIARTLQLSAKASSRPKTERK